MSSIRSSNHCVYDLKAHLVFLTKYRRNVLTSRVHKDLEKIFSKTCRTYESKLIECNGEADHVHLLIEYPPKFALSKLVNILKGVSSRYIRKKNYPEIYKKLWGSNFWSRSYYVGSCGGATLDVIKTYIENQGRTTSPT